MSREFLRAPHKNIAKEPIQDIANKILRDVQDAGLRSRTLYFQEAGLRARAATCSKRGEPQQ